MPIRLPYARMVQNFLLLWLDGSIDEKKMTTTAILSPNCGKSSIRSKHSPILMNVWILLPI
jgi:hypothetical protein